MFPAVPLDCDDGLQARPVTIASQCANGIPRLGFTIESDAAPTYVLRVFDRRGDEVGSVSSDASRGQVAYPGSSVDPRDWPGWREGPRGWERDPADSDLAKGGTVVVEATGTTFDPVAFAPPRPGCADPIDETSPLSLTLRVEVDEGGPLSVADWTVSATGPSPGSDVPRRAARSESGPAIEPGAYALLASGDEPEAAGYETAGWNCGVGTPTTPGASADAATATLAGTGGAVTCSIRYTPGDVETVSLGLEISVVGGPLSAADWRLSASGPSSSMGPGGGASLRDDVERDRYDLLAAGGAGADAYVTDGWNCGDVLTTRGASPDAATVDLTAGPDEVTCKIAYEHERAGVSLTLDVEVDGGPLSEGDWMLSAAAGPPDVGPAPGSDLVRGDVDPGESDLLAAGGAGADEYVTDGWNCGGVSTTPGVSPEAATVDLTAGPPEVTCSIVYTHVPGAVSLTLDVEVVGGPLSKGDWVLSAAGPRDLGPTAGDESVHGNVDPGTYDLLASSDEPSSARYAASGWVCGGRPAPSVARPQAATLELAEDAGAVTCVISFTWSPDAVVAFGLQVDVVGGPLSKADGRLSASGPSPPVGPKAGTEWIRENVEPGTYELVAAGLPAADEYETSGWECGRYAQVSESSSGKATVTFTADALVVTCSIRYVSQTRLEPVSLALEVEVEGGTLSEAAWSVSASGPSEQPPRRGANSSDGPIQPGSYELLADGVPGADEYVTDGWDCGDLDGDQGDSVDETTIDLAAGAGAVVCTIVYTFDETLSPPTTIPDGDDRENNDGEDEAQSMVFAVLDEVVAFGDPPIVRMVSAICSVDEFDYRLRLYNMSDESVHVAVRRPSVVERPDALVLELDLPKELAWSSAAYNPTDYTAELAPLGEEGYTAEFLLPVEVAVLRSSWMSTRVELDEIRTPEGLEGGVQGDLDEPTVLKSCGEDR
jgi:hypothetical protein